jgi:signal peptidase II
MKTIQATPDWKKLRPLIVTLVIIIVDQISKSMVVKAIPEDTIGVRLFGDFFWIVHNRNLGIAFSIGNSLSETLRRIFFIILPLVIICTALYFYFKSESLKLIHRIALAFIIGGGGGNLIDRIFRPSGVVDFLSFSMYGFLGFQRFPTFNVADLSITIGACLLLISGFLWEKENTGE